MSVEITPRGTRGAGMPKIPPGIMSAMNKVVFALGGKLAKMKLLEMTTVGAKSGQSRNTTLTYFPDAEIPDAWLIVASAGGDAKHPAWYFNLAKNPDKVTIDLGKGAFKVTPESLKGEDRTRAWQHVISTGKQFAGYEQSTDREIPVVRLTRA